MCGHNMPFGIEYVTDLLGINRKVRAADADSWYADCPFCGRRKKLNVNIRKDTWHCPACGEGGGMLKLYAQLKDLPAKEAAKELYRLFNGAEISVKTSIAVRKRDLENTPERPETAPLEKRDAAYRALLQVLSLEKYHRDLLQKRGLTDEAITHLGYKSTPQHGLSRIVDSLKSMETDLGAVPGFYGGQKKKLVYRRPGVFIPVRTLQGLISGCQIRYDDLPADASAEQKERYRKYTWFYSADKKDGYSIAGCENIHHAYFWPGTCLKRVCLTEGALKADIAAFLSRIPFIGLTGVSNTGRLAGELKTLKGLGTRKIYICLDMDYQTNPNVARAMEKITGICRGSGLDTTVVTWPEQFKGIDDLLAYKKSRGLL